MNKPPPFKGLNIRIPTTIPTKGREFINRGSGLHSSRALRNSLQDLVTNIMDLSESDKRKKSAVPSQPPKQKACCGQGSDLGLGFRV